MKATISRASLNWQSRKLPDMREPDEDEADCRMNAASYAVGYRRPPLHSRFKPGQSGNPSGRSKGSQNLKTMFEQVLTRRDLPARRQRHEEDHQGRGDHPRPGDRRDEGRLPQPDDVVPARRATGQFEEAPEPLQVIEQDHRGRRDAAETSRCLAEQHRTDAP